MTDIGKTIHPKSDQLNADDLIAGPLTIEITKVELLAGEQPIGINYAGDNGKPYKPCKSMRRVLVSVWGRDGAAYVGRKMTLFRDQKVMFGGVEVGGIRISHMSHITQDVTMALTVTRANRKPFTVRPLKETAPKALTDAEKEAVENEAAKMACKGVNALREWWGHLTPAEKAHLKPKADHYSLMAKDADKQAAEGESAITASGDAAPPADASAEPENPI